MWDVCWDVECWFTKCLCGIMTWKFVGLRQKLWFYCARMKQLKQLFLRLKQECFDIKHSLYNQFFIITSTDSWTFPNKDMFTWLCLLNNTTNARRRTLSILSSTECRIFGTLNPFRTFHPSLHESVARRSCDTTKRWLCFYASPLKIEEDPESRKNIPKKLYEMQISHFSIGKQIQAAH